MSKKGRLRRKNQAEGDLIKRQRAEEREEPLSEEEGLYLSQLLDEVAYDEIGNQPYKLDMGDKLLNQAINTVYRTRQNAARFIEAGVPEKYIDKEIGIRKGIYKDVEGMPAGIPLEMLQPKGLEARNIVPAPWVDTKKIPGVERRIHTKYEFRPELGRVEVVPVQDVMTGKALVTEVGDSKRNSKMDLEGFDMGSEYIADRMMKLMGAKRVVRANQNDKYGIDFKANFPADWVILPEAISGIDSEVRYATNYGVPTGTLPVQITTMTRPNNWKELRKKGEIATATADIMDTELRLGPRVNLLDAYTSAQNRGRLLTDQKNYDYGKLMKGDYDYLIMPGFNNKELNDNKYADKDPAGPTTILPDTIHMVDLQRAEDYIRSVTGRNASNMMYIRELNSGTRGGAPRARIYANMPENAMSSSGPVAENMLTSRNQGLVAQLVNDLGPIKNKETIQDIRRMAGNMMSDDIILSLK